MRLLEIDIKVYDKKQDELTNGESEDVSSKAFIDLDQVSSVFKNPVGNICAYMKGGESYWIYNYTLEQFVGLWNGIQENSLVPPNECSVQGVSVSCPDCSNDQMTCVDGKTTCLICGRVLA